MRVFTVSKSQRSLVTELQLSLATRDHKNTQPLDKWLDAAAFPVVPEDLKVFRRADAAAFEANRIKAERMKQERRKV